MAGWLQSVPNFEAWLPFPSWGPKGSLQGLGTRAPENQETSHLPSPQKLLLGPAPDWKMLKKNISQSPRAKELPFQDLGVGGGVDKTVTLLPVRQTQARLSNMGGPHPRLAGLTHRQQGAGAPSARQAGCLGAFPKQVL